MPHSCRGVVLSPSFLIALQALADNPPADRAQVLTSPANARLSGFPPPLAATGRKYRKRTKAGIFSRLVSVSVLPHGLPLVSLCWPCLPCQDQPTQPTPATGRKARRLLWRCVNAAHVGRCRLPCCKVATCRPLLQPWADPRRAGVVRASRGLRGLYARAGAINF